MTTRDCLTLFYFLACITIAILICTYDKYFYIGLIPFGGFFVLLNISIHKANFGKSKEINR